MLDGLAILFTCLSEVAIMACAGRLISRLGLDGCVSLIFVCYLYQRWQYGVDKKRPNEYGQVLALLQHEADGSSRRALFRRKRVVRAESSKEVPRLVGVIEDAGFAALRAAARPHGPLRR